MCSLPAFIDKVHNPEILHALTKSSAVFVQQNMRYKVLNQFTSVTFLRKLLYVGNEPFETFVMTYR